MIETREKEAINQVQARMSKIAKGIPSRVHWRSRKLNPKRWQESWTLRPFQAIWAFLDTKKIWLGSLWSKSRIRLGLQEWLRIVLDLVIMKLIILRMSQQRIRLVLSHGRSHKTSPRQLRWQRHQRSRSFQGQGNTNYPKGSQWTAENPKWSSLPGFKEQMEFSIIAINL